MYRPAEKIRSMPRAVTWHNQAPILFVLIFTGLLIAACGGPPKAAMLSSTSGGQAPVSASFTNSSENADEFQWDFGDGASATTRTIEESLSHEYTKSGTYNVTLRAIKQGEPPLSSAVSLTITVDPSALNVVMLDTSRTTLTPGDVHSFSVESLDKFDNLIPGLSVKFKADERAGQVDSGGVFTAGTKAGIYPGAVTVEVTEGGVTKSASADVTVQPAPLDHVTIEPAEPTVEVTKKQKFAVAALDQFDNLIPKLNYAYRADEGAGLVGGDGGFTAGTKAGKYDGAVTVEVTQGDVTKSASADVTITPGPLDLVAIEPGTASLEVTGEKRFIATAFDGYGNSITGLSFEYRADEQAGQVGGEGSFTAGSKAGVYEDAVTLEVTQDSITKSVTADVTVTPGPLDHVNLEPLQMAVEVTGSQQFSASAFDRFDNPILALDYTFRADDEAGGVDSEGVFTAGTGAGIYTAAVTVEGSQDSLTETATAQVMVVHGPA